MKGTPLTRAIASDLILELFDGQTDVPRSEIDEKVLELHISRGGISSKNPDVTIGTGLERLRGEGKADNSGKPKTGIWDIDSTGID